MLFILKLFLAIIVTEAITEIVVKSEIFNPLRGRVFKLGQESKFFNWLHNLLDCGYCFSVWAGTLVAILFFRDVHLINWVVDCFFIALVLHRSSNLFHNIMDRIHGS